MNIIATMCPLRASFLLVVFFLSFVIFLFFLFLFAWRERSRRYHESTVCLYFDEGSSFRAFFRSGAPKGKVARRWVSLIQAGRSTSAQKIQKKQKKDTNK